jgi:hypothetical protein
VFQWTRKNGKLIALKKPDITFPISSGLTQGADDQLPGRSRLNDGGKLRLLAILGSCNGRGKRYYDLRNDNRLFHTSFADLPIQMR